MGENMDSATRYTALNTKHDYLDHAIDAENRRPIPDYVRVTKMKREKLRIKDEMIILDDH
ncbi:MAG: YdcH family protein [Alphaproteobacteria bacterium]